MRQQGKWEIDVGLLDSLHLEIRGIHNFVCVSWPSGGIKSC